MGTSLLTGLRARFGGASDADACIAVQPLALADSDIGIVQAMLDKAGEQLAVRFKLGPDRGDIVLLDAALAAHLAPHLIHAFKDERPMLVIGGSRSDDLHQLSVAERFERRQHELIKQLRKMAVVRLRAAPGAVAAVAAVDTEATAAAEARSGSVRRDDQAAAGGSGSDSGSDSGFDSGFDSRLDAEQLVAEGPQSGAWQVLQHTLRGLRNPQTAPLTASYGPLANVAFDFAARLVSFDPLALQHLRSRRVLPQPAPGALPGIDAMPRTLQATAWDLGIAGAELPLVEAPTDWWHRPLTGSVSTRPESLTRVPRYLDVVRRIQAAPATPSQLRRQAHIGVPDLRAVLQACLMSGQAQWLRSSYNPENF